MTTKRINKSKNRYVFRRLTLLATEAAKDTVCLTGRGRGSFRITEIKLAV